MNTSSPIDEPVSPTAEDVIATAADSTLRGLLNTMWAEPHRLSSEALADRVRSMRGGSNDQIRAGLQQIMNELELHRWGYDLGFEAGYAEGQTISPSVDHEAAAPVSSSGGLIVKPATLTAWREGGQIVSIDQLGKNPDSWLRRHGVFGGASAAPLVLMVESSTSNPPGSGTVAYLHDEDRPLDLIARAISLLELTREALIAAGHEDFIPKAQDK